MSEYYSVPPIQVITKLLDINGNPTTNLFHAVAKKVSSDKDTFYIRIESMAPVHKSQFDTKNKLINPTFIKVDSEIYNSYLNYLSSSKEGFYSQARQLIKSKGLI